MHEEFAIRQADLLQPEQFAAGRKSRTRFLINLPLNPPADRHGRTR
jgi:hypothetical protein